MPTGLSTRTTREQIDAWAASGAMMLTGRPDAAPLGPPEGLAPRLTAVAALLADDTGLIGRRVTVDALALLGERAALRGLTRRGAISCGGATRLLRADDGWFALTLSRPHDVELVPAWLAIPDVPGHVWDHIEDVVGRSSVEWLTERGVLVGLPVAAVPTSPRAARLAPPELGSLPLCATRTGSARVTRSLQGLRVVDLGSLWAGPLCGSLLAAAGADVVKVESTTRPDGARRGPSDFFDVLNAGKRSVALDFGTREGRTQLRRLVATADIVVEASRPRALEQLGIDAMALLSGQGPRVWASITGYGRRAVARDRVAFGDDAAVAGGLVSWDAHGPSFCADAVADPATGLVSAAAIVAALRSGGRWLLDVSMAGVAAYLSGPTLTGSGPVQPLRPHARKPSGRAPQLGEHTAEVLGEPVGGSLHACS